MFFIKILKSVVKTTDFSFSYLFFFIGSTIAFLLLSQLY